MNQIPFKERVKAQVKLWMIQVRDFLLGLAVFIGLGWAFVSWLTYQPEWKEPGYANEESFEQAIDSGFTDVKSFEAAQKYQIETQAERDELNLRMEVGGFSSVEDLREAEELG